MDGAERGEADEAFRRNGAHDELAAEREFLAERVPGGVGVAGQQGGEPKVAVQDHPHEGAVEFAHHGNRALDEVPCVVIAALAEGSVSGGSEQIRELEDVPHRVQ